MAALSGCSSSDDATTTPPAPTEDGGTSDGAVAVSTSADDAAAIGAGTDSSVIATGAAQCSYSLSGGATYPTTGRRRRLRQQLHRRRRRARRLHHQHRRRIHRPLGGRRLARVHHQLPTAPVAGAVWKLMADDHHNGNCMLNIIKNKMAILYGAEQSSSTTIAGSVTITFASASVIPPMNHPKTTNYAYDVTIDATLPSQPAGGADVTMHGHFVQTKLPLGG